MQGLTRGNVYRIRCCARDLGKGEDDYTYVGTERGARGAMHYMFVHPVGGYKIALSAAQANDLVDVLRARRPAISLAKDRGSIGFWNSEREKELLSYAIGAKEDVMYELLFRAGYVGREPSIYADEVDSSGMRHPRKISRLLPRMYDLDEALARWREWCRERECEAVYFESHIEYARRAMRRGAREETEA